MQTQRDSRAKSCRGIIAVLFGAYGSLLVDEQRGCLPANNLRRAWGVENSTRLMER